MKQSNTNLREAFVRGEYKHALCIAEALLKDDPDNWDALYLRATIKSLPDPSVCNYEEAILSIRKAIERDPGNIQKAIGLAEILVMSGKYQEAEKVFRNVIMKEPSSYRAMIGLALLMGYPGTMVPAAEAELLLKHAIETDAAQWEAYYHLGTLKLRCGDCRAGAIMARRSNAEGTAGREAMER